MTPSRLDTLIRRLWLIAIAGASTIAVYLLWAAAVLAVRHWMP